MFAYIPTPDISDEEELLPLSLKGIKSSQSCSIFPLINPCVQSDPFKKIAAHELASLLSDPSSHPYDIILILDARYRYEYRGGRIKGAKNVISLQQMISIYERYLHQNVCIVFHCEFSSERGPNLMRKFRDYDRKVNQKSYPEINYPFIYLLEGGYARFYQEFPELCEGGYIPMSNQNSIENGELRESHSAYVREMSDNRRYIRVPFKKSRSQSTQSMELFTLNFLDSDISHRSPQFSMSSSQPLF